ncbi:MAG: tripartite tricarboxylate transporter permease, partial [Mailhella sp.]|nr:tripartite tricarboxylate transporter permease [Mailhella sp.]
FFMLAVGILASRYSHYVANVPNHIMFAAVAILCVFGSYCVSNNFADVIIMFSLGMLMLLLGKLSFPSAPLVLGLILGPIAEENFLRGSLIASTDVGLFNYFFTGPLNIGLIALCALSLAWGIIGEIRYSLKEHEGEC